MNIDDETRGLMSYKLIIFDMGNTLLDFHAGEHTDEEKDVMGTVYMSKYLERHHNIIIPASTIKVELIDKWYSDFYIRAQLIELDVCNYITAFQNTLGFPNIIIDCNALMRAFYKAYMDEVVVNNGAIEALESLGKKYKIGVISNCILFDEIYEHVFRSVGLVQYVDKFIFSYSRQIRKPDKRLFKEMISYFNVMPQESIMIGDSYKADLQPAKEMGMKVILYSKNSLQNRDCDYVVSNLDEVPGIVDRVECQI